MLMYGSEVLFIGKEILDFETVHLSFFKNMLGVKQQTTSVTIHGDTVRYPLFLKQQIIALIYWIRLIPNKNHRDVWENHRVEMPIVSSNKLNYVWLIHIKLIGLAKPETYIKFKFDHLLEEYLFYIPDTRWIKALSKLTINGEGMSSRKKIPLEQRICQRCTSNSVC